MRSRWSNAVGIAILSCSAVGCAPPTVSVRHVMPGALPLPTEVRFVVGDWGAAKADPNEGDVAFAMRAVTDRLEEMWPGSASRQGPLPAETTAYVSIAEGPVVEVTDTRGRRTGRRWNAETRQLEKFQMDTLVREVAVRVVFGVRSPDGRHLGAAEIRRSYSSAADPGVRGPLGLQRADDPQRVPTRDQIARRLLAECAERLVRMIAPVEVTARVQLRLAAGQPAQAGFAAAANEDFSAAIESFETALKAAPDDGNLHFDLAAAAEGAGKLDLAAAHYQRAWELSGKKDAEAQLGAARVRRVLAATQPTNARS